MKVVLFFVFLTLFFISTRSECVCPNGNCAFYDGSEPECYCFCNEASHDFPNGSEITCNFFPSGEFSSGGCSLCGPGETTEEVRKGTHGVSLTSTVPPTPSGPFLIQGCTCPEAQCSLYLGSYDQCCSFCSSLAKSYYYGTYKVTYFPWGEFSSGGCTCCGNIDPCGSFPWPI